MKEDLRTAVSLSVTLSGQLVQATVSLLTAQVAYVAYALASRETAPIYFEGTAIFTLLFFIISIYLSGKAITEARNSGASGNWNLSAGKNYFNWQAIFLILGITTLTATIFLSGETKDSEIDKKIGILDQKLTALEIESHAEFKKIHDAAKTKEAHADQKTK